MHDIASALMELDNHADRYIDVPLSLSHGTKKLPLGRFLRRKLRTYLGRSENTPEMAIAIQKERMRPLREAAKANIPQGLRRSGWAHDYQTQEEILKANEGRRIQLEAREKRTRKRRI